MKKVFSKEKFIEDMGEALYEKHKSWVDECDGLTKEEMKQKDYETKGVWMKEVKSFKASGLELLEMIKENKLECGTIIRYDTGNVERFPSDEERKIYEYYRYTAGDKKFHRCDKDGKLGVKYQKRFMNYETIYKEFEVFPAEPKIPYTFCTPDKVIFGSAIKEKIEEAMSLIYSGGFKF